jgi:hypothetical protein
MLWARLRAATRESAQPVWDNHTDRPLIYSHMPQIHQIDWAVQAVDAVLTHFARLLSSATLADATVDTIGQASVHARVVMFMLCAEMLIMPYGVHTPHTQIYTSIVQAHSSNVIHKHSSIL